jgi:hypothetical protein
MVAYGSPLVDGVVRPLHRGPSRGVCQATFARRRPDVVAVTVVVLIDGDPASSR